MNDEMLADRDSALAIACEWCGADAGQPCVRPDDQLLRNLAAHLPRLRGVGLAHASIVGKGIPDVTVSRPAGGPVDTWDAEDVPMPDEPPDTLYDLDGEHDTPEGWL